MKDQSSLIILVILIILSVIGGTYYMTKEKSTTTTTTTTTLPIITNISISMKKTYVIGEKIEAKLITNRDIYYFEDFNIFYLKRFENGTWKSISPSCFCSYNCNESDTLCGEEIACSIALPECKKLEKNNRLKWDWNQEECNMIYKNCDNTSWYCANYSRVTPGKYKLVFEYSRFDNCSELNTVEKEFETTRIR